MPCFEKSKTLNSMTLFFLYNFFFLSDFIDHIKSRKSGEEGEGLWTGVGEEILKG